MGIDIGTYEELLAHRVSTDQISTVLGVESIHFLSLEGIMKSIKSTSGYCNACFTGKYPFPVDTAVTKVHFEA